MFLDDIVGPMSMQEATKAPEKRALYRATQDAGTKDVIDQAYREVPGAKSDTEAIVGFVAKQRDALDQEQAENKHQAKQIRRLAKDLKDKEKRFQSLNAQMADMPGLTDQEKARMAQEIEREVEKDIEQRLPVAQHQSDLTAKQAQAKPAYNTKTGTPTGPIAKAPTPKTTPTAPASNVVQFPTASQQTGQQAQTRPEISVDQTTTDTTGANSFGNVVRHLATPGNPNLVYDPSAEKAQAELPFGAPAGQQAPAQALTVDPSLAQNSPMWLKRANSKLEEATNPAIGVANLSKLIYAAFDEEGNVKPLPPKLDLEFDANSGIIPLTNIDIKKIWDIIGSFTAKDAEDLKLKFSDYQTTVSWLDQQGIHPDLSVNQAKLDLPMTQQPMPYNNGLNENAWSDGTNNWSSEHDQWAKESAMSELDIQYQDYKDLEPGAFHSRYKMTKDAWANKNWSLIKSSETVHEARAGLPQDLAVQLTKLNYQQKNLLKDYIYKYQSLQFQSTQLDVTLQKLLSLVMQLTPEQIKSVLMVIEPSWSEKQEAKRQEYWAKRNKTKVAPTTYHDDGTPMDVKEATARERWLAAAAERQKKHDEIERRRQEAAKQGKTDVAGSIKRLEKALGEEDNIWADKDPAELGQADAWYGRRPMPDYYGYAMGTPERKAYLDAYKSGEHGEKDYGGSLGRPHHKFEEGEGDPEGLPHLTPDLASHIADQINTEGPHAIVKSVTWGDGAADELVQKIQAMLQDYAEAVKESAAWKRKEGKSKTGGLNKKGVASYRREHPGSKLQTAVTTKPSKLKPGSKAAKRRKSFCARMGGMKGPMKKPNGEPTRKALALRKWNCESLEQLGELIESQMNEVKQRLDAKCWKGKHKEGTKIKGGVRVNNCVPNESSNDFMPVDSTSPVGGKVTESYWTKLQRERSTKLNSLVNELTESLKK